MIRRYTYRVYRTRKKESSERRIGRFIKFLTASLNRAHHSRNVSGVARSDAVHGMLILLHKRYEHVNTLRSSFSFFFRNELLNVLNTFFL